MIVEKIYNLYECPRFTIYFYLPHIKQGASKNEKNRNGYYVRILAVSVFYVDGTSDNIGIKDLVLSTESKFPFSFVIGLNSYKNFYSLFLDEDYTTGNDFGYVSFAISIAKNSKLVAKHHIGFIDGNFEEHIRGKKITPKYPFLKELFDEYLRIIEKEEAKKALDFAKYEEKIKEVNELIKSSFTFEKLIPEKINDEIIISRLNLLSPSEIHYKYGNCVIYFANNNLDYIAPRTYEQFKVKIIIGIQTEKEYLPFEKISYQTFDGSFSALCVKNYKNEIQSYNYVIKPGENERTFLLTPDEEQMNKPKITLEEEKIAPYLKLLENNKIEKEAYDKIRF